MEFRTIQYQDLKECVNLYIHVFNNEPWNDQWTIEQAYNNLNDIYNTPGFHGFIVLIDNQIRGFILGNRKQWWTGKIFTLQEMCVASQLQGKGVGSKLLSFAKEELKKHNFQSIDLLTEKDFPAEKFYLKNDFNEVEGTRLYSLRLSL